MKNFFKSFARSTDGAVTVDWVVLTAASVTLALLVIGAIKIGVDARVVDVTTSIAANE